MKKSYAQKIFERLSTKRELLKPQAMATTTEHEPVQTHLEQKPELVSPQQPTISNNRLKMPPKKQDTYYWVFEDTRDVGQTLLDLNAPDESFRIYGCERGEVGKKDN